jgi:hypothetical protein
MWVSGRSRLVPLLLQLQSSAAQFRPGSISVTLLPSTCTRFRALSFSACEADAKFVDHNHKITNGGGEVIN